MTNEQLQGILTKHKAWLNDEDGGERANLSGADLSYAHLSYAHLLSANLSYANLSYANLRSANLSYANLSHAHLLSANLSYANLSHANLRGADLSYANLSYANLSGADLSYANLRGANLRGADLDYSCWPLWCGSLNAKIDDRIARQLLYHCLRVIQCSPDVSREIKAAALTPELIAVANQFHRVQECREIRLEEPENEPKCDSV